MTTRTWMTSPLALACVSRSDQRWLPERSAPRKHAHAPLARTFAAASLIMLGLLGSRALVAAQLVYPEARKGDVVETLHGVEIADPYRWMEDLDAPETKAWVAAENEVTFAFLERIPARQELQQRLTKLWDYERFGLPEEQGGRYFYTRNDGLQPQAVLYVAERLDAAPRVLINPNEMSKDGTVALSGTSVSRDGKLLAYAVSEAGSDWQTYKVRSVDTGADLADELKWVKFSDASWTKDNAGFYYSRYDEPQGDKMESVNRFPKIFYHKVGTPQADDQLIYHEPNEPDWGFGAGVSDDGRYLIISISRGTERKNRVSYQDLSQPGAPIVPLITEFEAQFGFLGNDGPLFYFFTTLDAPRGRVIAIDTAQADAARGRPNRASWREIIPQSADTLSSVSLLTDRFIATYLHDAHSVVRVFDLTGKPAGEVQLPGVGTAAGFGGRRDQTETFYMYTSFATPTTIYRYDVKTGQSTVFRQPKVEFDPDAYEVQQVFYNSKDGTRVPLFLTYRKGLALNGDNPTLLYGYGGFNAPMTPAFSVHRVAWLERGGVYAVACIRGGGEYGEAWHDAGKLKNKQNCFDDFCAAAEWLIANKYTSSKKLAIQGGSNGGLLVGACMTQRPELFGACLPAVGVMDMLRFHLFTIGWAWKSDYGDPNHPDDFKTALAYSPLHNIKPGTCYPPTLVTTSDHDDRVVPAHSFKFTAALQAAQGCDNPTLIRIEVRAGHGAGKPTQKIIEERADEYAFLVKVFGMPGAE